jgi:hypothetical protein
MAPFPSRPLAPVGNAVVPVPPSQARAAVSQEVPPPAWPSTPEPSKGQERWPWPELPESSSSEATDGAVLLLYWERLNRLDREQRGE